MGERESARSIMAGTWRVGEWERDAWGSQWIVGGTVELEREREKDVSRAQCSVGGTGEKEE